MSNLQQSQTIQKKLEKKQAFKEGVKELTSAVCACPLGEVGQDELKALFPLVNRTHQLLRTRHTGVCFWKAGDSLFSICLVRSPRVL